MLPSFRTASARCSQVLLVWRMSFFVLSQKEERRYRNGALLFRFEILWYCHINVMLISYSIVIKTMFSLPDTLNLCTQAAAWSVHRNYWFPFLRSPIRQEERCAQYPVTESPSLAIWYFLLNAGSCLGFDSQALEGIRWFPQERMFSVQGSHLLLSLLFFIYPENHFLNTFL